MMNMRLVYDVLLRIAPALMLTPELCAGLPDEIFHADLMGMTAEILAMLGFHAVRGRVKSAAASRAKPESFAPRGQGPAAREKGPLFPEISGAGQTDGWSDDDENDEDEASAYLREDAGDDAWADEVFKSLSPALAQYLREIRGYRVFTKDEEREKFEELQSCHDELVASCFSVWVVTSRGDMAAGDEGGMLQWGMIHEIFSLLGRVRQYMPGALEEECSGWLSAYRRAEEVRNEIVQHNLRFAITVAAKYRGRGMDFWI